MISTTLAKLTVRPRESVSRPSSSSASNTLNTSGCAFSTSSSSTTEYGRRAHRLGELATLVVADVARRRAGEPRHRVTLHVLGHVQAHHRRLVVEQELGQRLGELGLADAGRPEKDQRSNGTPGIAETGARPLDRQAHPMDGIVLADDSAAQPILDAEQLLALALEHARDRDTGPVGDHARDVHRLDGILEQPLAGLRLAQPASAAARACSSAGMRP